LVQPPKPGTGIDPHALDIEIFDREDCLQCDKAREFLTRLKTLQPQLKIITRDVRKEPAALQLLKRMAQNQGNTELDYPAFVVGGQLIIGFSEEAGTAQRILDTLAASRPANQQQEKDLQLCTSGNEPGCALIPPPPEVKPQHVVFNFMGYNVQLVQIGLPLFTVAMGMLDGLNHSSLWVLMLIISLLAPAKDRTLMFAIAGTFIAAQGLIYFILMAAWFNLILQIDISRLTQILFAVLAFVAGTIYFKKYLFFGQSISLSLNEISKPGIYTRIRKITDSKTPTAALLGTILLAAIVQISELTYTSVFPALYSRVLHLQHLGNLSNYSYLLLYDFAYMLDDLIVLALGMITLNSLSLKKFDQRILMLLSTLGTMALGAYLILVKP
jgi:glutaredoxin